MSKYLFIYHNDKKCPKCEQGLLSVKETLLSNPPQYIYKCPVCEYEEVRNE